VGSCVANPYGPDDTNVSTVVIEGCNFQENQPVGVPVGLVGSSSKPDDRLLCPGASASDRGVFSSGAVATRGRRRPGRVPRQPVDAHLQFHGEPHIVGALVLLVSLVKPGVLRLLYFNTAEGARNGTLHWGRGQSQPGRVQLPSREQAGQGSADDTEVGTVCLSRYLFVAG
jgi:hypothetical protein